MRRPRHSTDRSRKGNYRCFFMGVAQFSFRRGAEDFFRRSGSHKRSRELHAFGFLGRKFFFRWAQPEPFESATLEFAGASLWVLFYLCCCADGKDTR